MAVKIQGTWHTSTRKIPLTWGHQLAPCVFCEKPTEWGFEHRSDAGIRKDIAVCLTCNDRPDVRDETGQNVSAKLAMTAVV